MINLNNKNKIFLTGITASGKTYWAKKLSSELNIPYYDFDFHWSFQNKDSNYEKAFLNELPNSFIIDAIPYINRYKDFQEYRKKNDIEIICLFNSDIMGWVYNIMNKSFYTAKSPQFKIDFYTAWIYFYTTEIDLIKPTKFYDNATSLLMTSEEFQTQREKIINQLKELKSKNQPLLKDYLDSFNPKKFDKFYQDIECIDFIGYSKSYKTWENIKDLVEWKNKSVIDLGCYHGYFSFKADQAGALKVIGLEMHDSVLHITKLIKHINSSKAEFEVWGCGQPTPKADIALVLNVLHHATDVEETLKNINTKIAIFEIERTQIDLIKKHFKIIKEADSHRIDKNQNRVILLGEKLKNDIQ
jgi:adenylate kinase family enzyme